MATHIWVENFFQTTITGGTILASGNFTMTLASPPSSDKGFLVISPSNALLREVVFFSSVSGSTVTVLWENRFSPKAHSIGEEVKMNDVAQLFEYTFNNFSDTFYIEKKGWLAITVYGGEVFYNGATQTIADTNLTLVDNTINYITYTYPTNTIANEAVDSSRVKAIVTTVWGIITNITYRQHKESFIDFAITLSDALPDQSWQEGKFLGTDGTTPSWQIAVPSGVVMPFSWSSAPTWWLLADGSNVSRATYANLYAAIWVTYWVWDGSTTFTLPNYSGRIPVGKRSATSKGTATMTIASPCVVTNTTHWLANGNKVYFITTGALPTGLTASTEYYIINATVNTFQLATTLNGTAINTSGTQSGTHTLYSADFNTLWGTGGEDLHILSSNEIPAHTHSIYAPKSNAAASADAISSGTIWSNNPTVNTGSTWWWLAHMNLQPYIVQNYIIKT